MRPEIALAKLTAHPASLNEFTRTLRSGKYSPIALAGAMAGFNSDGERLGRAPYLFGLAKWCQDMGVVRELQTLAYLETIDFAKDKGWTSERGWKERAKAGSESLRRLAAMALADSLGYGRCEVCEGRQWIYPIGALPERCANCLGTGVASPSGATLAAQFGISESNWCRYWGDKYRLIVAMMFGWEIIVLSHIAAKLEED